MGVQKKVSLSVEIHGSRPGFPGFKGLATTVGCLLLLATWVSGCKPKPRAVSAGIFKGPFQTESQFIVQTVVADLAEQMFYAKFHRLPEAGYFRVVAREIPDTPLDTAEYELKTRMDSIHSVSEVKLNLRRPIWSPTVYQGVAAALARAVGLNPKSTGQFDETSLLSDLTDGSPESIENENFILSRDLEEDFTDAKLHEQAAVLLGAFALREHSGDFFDIRFPLCQMTAHLVMARFLNGTGPYGINGQLANAILLTLMGDQAPALKQLSRIPTNDMAVAEFVRTLQARNTGDYRTLEAAGGLSRIESIECFAAMSDFNGAPLAWQKLSDTQRYAIDFIRIANQEDYSVEMGHQLLALAIPLELEEIRTVYQLSHHQKLTGEGLVKALNQLPEHGFTQAGGAVHVRVIGWGLWANFLQHQLCHAIQQNFRMLRYKWGAPDDAKKFAAICDQRFAGLRLYPFVQRMDSLDVQSYHQSVDACIQLTLNSPQLVPSGCWDWTFHKPEFAQRYPPNFDPHINEWFGYNPPLGTVYDLGPRLYHPTLTDRSDAVAYFEKLHALAPYDCRVINFILTHKYHNHPTYDQAMALYSNLLPYSLTAIRTVADTVKDQPERYDRLLLQAAKLNPSYYYDLAEDALERHHEDLAAQYYDLGCHNDPDRVRASYYAERRVRYYLKEGQTAKARAIADEAGEVYSSAGLKAEGVFQELTGNYDAAFKWYARIDERYGDSSELLAFCARYRAETGSSRFDAVWNKLLKQLFPEGIQKVTLNDFHGPPKDGIAFTSQNALLRAAGLKAGDVIVAVYGIRVHNTEQYTYGRESRSTPQLDLIVWQGDGYHEVTASPPNHLFGVGIGDYTSR